MAGGARRASPGVQRVSGSCIRVHAPDACSHLALGRMTLTTGDVVRGEMHALRGHIRYHIAPPTAWPCSFWQFAVAAARTEGVTHVHQSLCLLSSRIDSSRPKPTVCAAYAH